MLRSSIPAWAIAFALVFGLPGPTPAQDPISPTLFGYAYPEQSVGGELWAVGNVFTLVAVAHPGDLTIVPLDDVENEYTILVEGLRIERSITFGGFRLVEFTAGAEFSAYEDSRATGTSADFGTESPPNAVAPATFIDGDLLLRAVISSEYLGITIDESSGIGSFAIDVESPIPDCVVLGPNFRGNLITVRGEVALPGAAVDPPLELPAPGYEYRMMGEMHCQYVLPADPSTWGRVKALYR